MYMYGSIIYIIEVHVSVIAVYYGGLCIPVFQDIDTSQSFLTFLLCCLGYFYDIVIGVCACSVVPLYEGSCFILGRDFVHIECLC